MCNEIKLALIICCIVGLVFVQICVNPEGYNYLLYPFIPLLLYYFKDITSLKIGEFEMKRVQQESKKTLAEMYKSLLFLQIEKGSGCLVDCDYFDDSKYKGFQRIVKSIRTSQKEINFEEEINKELNESIKESAEKLVEEIKSLVKLYDVKTESGKLALTNSEAAIKQLQTFLT